MKHESSNCDDRKNFLFRRTSCVHRWRIEALLLSEYNCILNFFRIFLSDRANFVAGDPCLESLKSSEIQIVTKNKYVIIMNHFSNELI
jgi:hypothetical protein